VRAGETLGRRIWPALLWFACFACPRVSAGAAPTVWIVDDGEKIRRDATSTPFARGEHNAIWQPHEAARLFAMRGESVALQVVVAAGDAPLERVSVDLDALDGPEGIRFEVHLPSRASPNGSAARWVARPIERFVEHFVTVTRPSGGATPGESLGWEVGAAPEAEAWVGPVPDALVPVELATVHGSPWVPYPMHIEPLSNGIVWIDLNVPSVQTAGVYRGSIVVRQGVVSLETLPIELTVVDATLPAEASTALLYYDPEELARRVGAGAEEHLWQVLHAHRIAPLHDATTPEDVRRQRDALDGAAFTLARGYLGPAAAIGDGTLSLGAYGALEDPDAGRLQALVSEVASAGLFATTRVFIYADDEACTSPRGPGWRALVRESRDPDVRRVRVAWTCSADPAEQDVDDPMLLASDYDVTKAQAARGKRVGIYNGVLPHSGTFLIDADAVSPRVNGWLAAMYEVPQWFYWESTYWYGRRGNLSLDPFRDAETFHNEAGDWANGDGSLLYPGRQLDAFGDRSLDFAGVIPSIRLKNWRRGIEDGLYLRMARQRDPVGADAVAHALIPTAFHEARAGAPSSWSPRGDAFFEARRALLAIAMGPVVEKPAAAPILRRPLRGRLLQIVVAAAAAFLAVVIGVLRAVLGRRRAAESPISKGPRSPPEGGSRRPARGRGERT
jgi:hypothetical protein